jgi:hypothetical protein
MVDNREVGRMRGLVVWVWVAAVLVVTAPSALAVDIEWVTVGDPGNFPDSEIMTCCGDSIGSGGYGAVSNRYRIGRSEVTNAQYAEFLNAVASTDTNFLYNFNMGLSFAGLHGGITVSGTSGSWTYATIAGRESMPVNWVSFWDAARFANWLHNGQPTGAQDNTTTEDGAYTITPTGIANNTITRNAGATVFIPSENEWYKAAYYDPLVGYYDYPTGTNAPTTCTTPGATANTANCGNAVADVTVVGGYTSSPSPYASYDQGGNVGEWSETIFGTKRIQRGGGFDSGTGGIGLPAFQRPDGFPENEVFHLGFRVASISPQPTPALSPLALGLMTSLLGGAAYWMLRSART